MHRCAIHRLRAAVIFAVMLLLAQAGRAESPDPASLLEAMQRALIPTVAQFTRVHIYFHSDQPGGGTKTWDALVLRARGEDGPRSALSFVAPDQMAGSGMLTAPTADGSALGLWLYSQDERRSVRVSPLEPDRQFLTTRFNFEDLAFTTRATQPPVLLGSEQDGERLVWKVETRPVVDRYYSRMLTFIADDTQLPTRREYYDRADKLWKVVSYTTERVDGMPTVMRIALKDVQSRDVCEWTVQAVHYEQQPLDARVLSPAGLGVLTRHHLWRELEGKKQAQETGKR